MCLFVYTKVSFSDHITVLLVQLNEIFNMDKVLFCCKKSLAQFRLEYSNWVFFPYKQHLIEEVEIEKVQKSSG